MFNIGDQVLVKQQGNNLWVKGGIQEISSYESGYVFQVNIPNSVHADDHEHHADRFRYQRREGSPQLGDYSETLWKYRFMHIAIFIAYDSIQIIYHFS